jgi:purine nucleosidase
VLVHVDTDIGGDPDDVAALAMLAGWPGVELTGVTTTVDPGGVRAGYARHCLDLLGLPEVPVAAGAEATLTDGTRVEPLPELWPAGIAPRPAPPGAGSELLAASLRRGAVVVAIGPLSTVARLEQQRPGILAGARLVVMGGWLRTPDDGLPARDPDQDFNVACDPEAARTVFAAAGDLRVVTLADTLQTHLRRTHLARLHAAGPLGDLLADQAEGYAVRSDHARLAAEHAGLPEDLLLFLHDPLACAVAVGWPGARLVEKRLTVAAAGRGLRLVPAAGGRPVRVVDDLDAEGFADRWLTATVGSAALRRRR